MCSICLCVSLQKLLLKDLPDPTEKRRYTRRPTMVSLQGELLPGNRNVGGLVHKLDRVPEGETPSITVEDLRANWGSSTVCAVY